MTLHDSFLASLCCPCCLHEHACPLSVLIRQELDSFTRNLILLHMVNCCSYAASVTGVKDHNWSCSIKYIQNEYIMQSCMLLSVLAGAWYCTASSSTMHHGGCCMVLIHAPGAWYYYMHQAV